MCKCYIQQSTPATVSQAVVLSILYINCKHGSILSYNVYTCTHINSWYPSFFTVRCCYSSSYRSMYWGSKVESDVVMLGTTDPISQLELLPHI